MAGTRSTRRAKKPITVGIIGLGSAKESNIQKLLEDVLDGVDSATFVIPITKEHYTDAVQAVVDYISEEEDTDVSWTAVVDDTTAKVRTLKSAAKEADSEVKAADVHISVVNEIKDADDARLFVFYDGDLGDEDGGAYDAIEYALDNDVAVFDLCAGLKPINFNDGDDDEKAEDAEEEEPEPEPEPKAKRTRRTKAAAEPEPTEEVEEQEEAEDAEEGEVDGDAARADLPPYKDAVKLGIRALRTLARDRQLAPSRQIGGMSQDDVLELLYPDGANTVVVQTTIEDQIASAQHAASQAATLQNGAASLSMTTLIEMIAVSVADRVKELVDA